ncbi:MAG TPA: hypothetical protein VEZ40_07335 [Pyrinomonadaceae bacterium]|nr:hypothetical protein [Pyrinomonadaceae bacterium]
MRFLWLPIAVLSLCLLTSNAGAQQPQSPTPAQAQAADARPTNCEDRTAIVDGIGQSVAAAELIIVISRLGDGDTRADVGRHRLHNARTYWTEFLPVGMRRKRETIILGEGEKVRGFGRLEFYTGGKLFYTIKFRGNQHLLVGECYPPDDSYIRNRVFNLCEVKSNQIFYPCRDQRARWRRIRGAR